MKNLFLIFLCFGLVLTSCDDDDDNLDFDTIGQTFRETINFTPDLPGGNIATENIVVPSNISVFESDVPLVFVLDPVASDNAGVDVFEPLPRVFFFENNGFAQFRFNFIFDNATGIFDLDLILESDDFSSLGPDFTDNQIFRIVIVPSDFAEANPDISFEELQSQLDLDIEPLKN